MSYDECYKTLSESAGLALGALISKFKCLETLGYDTYLLYLVSGVRPILTYESSVWVLKLFKDIGRGCSYYLELHISIPTSALWDGMVAIFILWANYLLP